jgi:NAD-dependent SIR2 family protein deacetylase
VYVCGSSEHLQLFNEKSVIVFIGAGLSTIQKGIGSWRKFFAWQ